MAILPVSVEDQVYLFQIPLSFDQIPDLGQVGELGGHVQIGLALRKMPVHEGSHGKVYPSSSIFRGDRYQGGFVQGFLFVFSFLRVDQVTHDLSLSPHDGE